MFSPTTYDWTDKRVAYDALVHDLTHLLGDERDLVANASQAAALVWHALPDLNWAGFYFFDGTELVVGPFQGLPACTRIALDARRLRRRGVAPRHRSSCPTSTPSPATSPATADRDPSWSCRSSPAARCAASSTWTRRRPARFDDADRIGVERLVAAFVGARPPGRSTGRPDPAVLPRPERYNPPRRPSPWQLSPARRSLTLAALASVTVAPMSAQTPAATTVPPLIDRELFFGNPEIAGAQLSPDGKFIAFLKPWKDTRNSG